MELVVYDLVNLDSYSTEVIDLYGNKSFPATSNNFIPILLGTKSAQQISQYLFGENSVPETKISNIKIDHCERCNNFTKLYLAQENKSRPTDEAFKTILLCQICAKLKMSDNEEVQQVTEMNFAQIEKEFIEDVEKSLLSTQEQEKNETSLEQNDDQESPTSPPVEETLAQPLSPISSVTSSTPPPQLDEDEDSNSMWTQKSILKMRYGVNSSSEMAINITKLLPEDIRDPLRIALENHQISFGGSINRNSLEEDKKYPVNPIANCAIFPGGRCIGSVIKLMDFLKDSLEIGLGVGIDLHDIPPGELYASVKYICTFLDKIKSTKKKPAVALSIWAGHPEFDLILRHASTGSKHWIHHLNLSLPLLRQEIKSRCILKPRFHCTRVNDSEYRKNVWREFVIQYTKCAEAGKIPDNLNNVDGNGFAMNSEYNSFTLIANCVQKGILSINNLTEMLNPTRLSTEEIERGVKCYSSNLCQEIFIAIPFNQCYADSICENCSDEHKHDIKNVIPGICILGSVNMVKNDSKEKVSESVRLLVEYFKFKKEKYIGISPMGLGHLSDEDFSIRKTWYIDACNRYAYDSFVKFFASAPLQTTAPLINLSPGILPPLTNEYKAEFEGRKWNVKLESSACGSLLAPADGKNLDINWQIQRHTELINEMHEKNPGKVGAVSVMLFQEDVKNFNTVLLYCLDKLVETPNCNIIYYLNTTAPKHKRKFLRETEMISKRFCASCN